MPSKCWFPKTPTEASTRLRLFCLPHAGGGASLFAHWGKALPADIAVVPVQLPGHQERVAEPLFQHMEPLVEALGEAMAPLCNLPFAVFGHSMGGLVGFEVTRWLRQRRNLCPRVLIVAAFPAPQLPRRHSPLHELPEHELLDSLGQRFGGLPAELAGNAELMKIMLPILRADLAVVETYQYTPGTDLDCPLVVLGGADDPGVSAADLVAWRTQTAGPFSFRMFPGGHFFLHCTPARVLRAIADPLNQFGARG
jgi:medium-chain acyl-[acyl-carrier-protein] hydrolase